MYRCELNPTKRINACAFPAIASATSRSLSQLPMSLSRILNDPPPPPRAPPEPPSAIDTPPSSNSPLNPRQSPPPRRYSYQPVSYQGAGGWDPYSGNYVQGDIFPLGPGGNYYPQRDLAPPSSVPPEPLDTSLGAYYKEGENDHASKKRRKTADDDPDYHPPASRRVRSLSLIPSRYHSNTSPAWTPEKPPSFQGCSSREFSFRHP